MDEVVEILTEDGKQTGERINKSIAHKEGVCHGISAIALIDKEGRLLIQQRSSNKKTEPNKWDLSGAGHIDVDETPEQAAVRELFEETGIKVEIEELKLILLFLNSKKIFFPFAFSLIFKCEILLFASDVKIVLSENLTLGIE